MTWKKKVENKNFVGKGNDSTASITHPDGVLGALHMAVCGLSEGTQAMSLYSRSRVPKTARSTPPPPPSFKVLLRWLVDRVEWNAHHSRLPSTSVIDVKVHNTSFWKKRRKKYHKKASLRASVRD